MLAYTYEENVKFVLKEKEKPTLQSEDDAIVRVTLASICSSDLHIKHGAVPRAVPGITVGHEMVGIVEETGRRDKGKTRRSCHCKRRNILRGMFFL